MTETRMLGTEELHLIVNLHREGGGIVSIRKDTAERAAVELDTLELENRKFLEWGNHWQHECEKLHTELEEARKVIYRMDALSTSRYVGKVADEYFAAHPEKADL
jgi:ATP-dependent Clp protease adapter protein ClpS